ncbi:MAG: hypothetical protein L6R39_001823 [Caloplaca ligustica]|nr:MAG: hypothetical protein L6R39_001823 [Caloplaca ligustica]
MKIGEQQTGNRATAAGTVSGFLGPEPRVSGPRISEAGTDHYVDLSPTTSQVPADVSVLQSMQLFNRLASTRLAGSIHLKTPLVSRTRTLAMSTGAAETDTQAENAANSSGITPSSLQDTLKEKLQAEYVDIEDMSGGCGQAFNAMIVSPQFEKKNTLARHRLVNSALKTEIAAIHAWTPKCFTPEEWQKKQSEAGG